MSPRVATRRGECCDISRHVATYQDMSRHVATSNTTVTLVASMLGYLLRRKLKTRQDKQHKTVYTSKIALLVALRLVVCFREEALYAVAH